MHHPLAFVIAESSQVGEARRTTIALAASLGFNETKQGEFALIVTEIANNLVRHATHGELLLRVIETEGIVGIEFTAVDQGPGMASVSQCLRDGYSTTGTPGNGLGAIARLSDWLEVYSVPGGGTVLVSQLWALPTLPLVSPAPMEYGVVNRPKPGQDVCGDAWAVEQFSDRSLFFLADGLGHGPDAAIASQEAVRAFRKYKVRRPKEILEAVHASLHNTRGVAVAVAEISLTKEEVCFAGIGNVAGTVVAPGRSQNMVSHNGTAGHQVRKIQEFFYSWTPGALLVMHSDGLSSRWQLERYPGLTVRHPGLIAGVLYRDFQRVNDDATLLVGRSVRSDQIL